MNNISRIYHAKGDENKALGYLEQALAIAQKIDDRYGIAERSHNMGAMLFEQNRYEEAIPLMVQAFQIFQQLGVPQADNAEGYLEAIIEQIGEERFKEIISG